MLYGIFSDIHSNLEALDIVLDYFQKNKVDSYICCGDIVGYGPDPNECVEKVKSLHNLMVVLGNHDAAICDLKDITWFNEYARKAILWTKKQLTAQNRQYLAQLDKIVIKDNFTIAHGSPRDPVDEYLLYADEMQENIKFFNTQLCFVGHSHVPFVFSTPFPHLSPDNDLKIVHNNETVKIHPRNKYIINVGSVGQPRDSNPSSCCILYDNEKQELVYVRLEYNIAKVQDKMYKFHLPIYLIERLSLGH